MVYTDKKLLKRLPRKWADTLFERLNGKYSISHIRSVIGGRKNNMDIFEAAIKLAEEYQNRLDKIKEKLNNLN